MITECLLREITIEYLSARGERPYRILRGGSSLWETHVPAMRLALVSALQSVEGGVQGSIATKQESCPESAPRTETAEENFAQLVTTRNVAESAHAKGVNMNIWQADVRALDWAVKFIEAQLARSTKSAPDLKASHNSGERDPSVMPDCPGADTKSDGGSMQQSIMAIHDQTMALLRGDK